MAQRHFFTGAKTLAPCRVQIRALIPLAASLGQPISIENVWNRMVYDHDSGLDQSADRFVKFVDSFNSLWGGMSN